MSRLRPSLTNTYQLVCAMLLILMSYQLQITFVGKEILICEAPTTVQSGWLYHGSDGERATCSDAGLPSQSSITEKGSVPVFCNSSGQLHRGQDGPLEGATIVDMFYEKGPHMQVEFDTVATDCTLKVSQYPKSSSTRRQTQGKQTKVTL